MRSRGLAASRGATDFGEYFVYFSFFLVVSALLLAALFFKLGIEQRVREVGLLRAVGFGPPDVRGCSCTKALAARRGRQRPRRRRRDRLCVADDDRAAHLVGRMRSGRRRSRCMSRRSSLAAGAAVASPRRWSASGGRCAALSRCPSAACSRLARSIRMRARLRLAGAPFGWVALASLAVADAVAADRLAAQARSIARGAFFGAGGCCSASLCAFAGSAATPGRAAVWTVRLVAGIAARDCATRPIARAAACCRWP